MAKSEDELSRRWREETRRYVAAVNEFVRRGLADGWEAAGDEPEDTREPLADAVLDAVHRANAASTTETLRDRFPPAHGPFLEHLKDNGTSIPVVLLLDDGRVLARIGAPYEDGHVVLVANDEVRPLPEEVITVGRSANRRLFAVASAEYVAVHDGWEGPEVSRYEWPEPEHGCPVIERLIPFPRGDRVLLVSRQGVFVLTGYGAIRLLPTTDAIREFNEWLAEKHPDDPPEVPRCDMVHGAMSRDGRLVAAGYQSSQHYVFDGETYEIVAEIGHWSEYPHHAVFSADESLIAFNSCHFYSGVTIGVPTDLLPGLKTEAYDPFRCRFFLNR